MSEADMRDERLLPLEPLAELDPDNPDHFDWLLQRSKNADIVLAALRSEVESLRKKLEEAEAELKWIKDVTEEVMAEKCPTDEMHCTCVPLLRAELSRLKRETEKLPEVLFVRHIEGHLREDQQVICKICGFSILEIAEAARLSRLEEKHG